MRNKSGQYIVVQQGCGYLGTMSTVFQAEIFAIYKALDKLKEIAKPTRNNILKYGNIIKAKTTIYCDSQAAILALNKQPCKSLTVIKCLGT